MLRLLLFLATEKGYAVLQELCQPEYLPYIGGVVTFSETMVEKDWSQSIGQLAKEYEIPCFSWMEISKGLCKFVRENRITSAIAIGWRFMIPLEINAVMQNDLIIFHDSLLPKYRGFAPTPTAIIMGDHEVGVTALFASDEVDAGDIILQERLMVPEDMYMEEIIQQQAKIYASMVRRIFDDMVAGKVIQGFAQDEAQATYSIWRDREDCRIDWKRSARDIYNFVRALGKPYLGAFSEMDGKRIVVHRVEIVKKEYHFSIRDCGKIWRVRENCPEIICGQGMIRIVNAVDEQGENVRFSRLRCRLQ